MASKSAADLAIPIWNDRSGIEHHGVKHLSDFGGIPMTALGQKRRFETRPVTSGLPQQADDLGAARYLS
jgi:hypothetical protein